MKRILIYSISIIAFILLVTFLFGGEWTSRQNVVEREGTPIQYNPVNLSYSSRPFAMGLTIMPPDVTPEAMNSVYDFNAQHADFIYYHLENGVPWQEAFENTSLPSAVIKEWDDLKRKIPKGHKLYVSITPLDGKRENLAPYWGASQKMPLPAPWDTYALNDPSVKQAYLTYAQQVIEYFKPDYFSIGNEVNGLLVNHADRWEAYKDLHRFVYTMLKKDYPDLPIFATFMIGDIIGAMPQADAELNRRELRELLDYNDYVALTVYPYTSNFRKPVPEDIFDVALSFGKPVAIAEAGYPSKDIVVRGITVLRFTEEDQYQFVELLLRKAHEHRFPFVMYWQPIDYDKYLRKLPRGETKDLLANWVYDGLQTSDGRFKKALYLWDAHLKLPKR